MNQQRDKTAAEFDESIARIEAANHYLVQDSACIKPIKFRCSKDHEWEETPIFKPGESACQLVFNLDGILGPRYCMRCIADLMLKMDIGVVSVKE